MKLETGRLIIRSIAPSDEYQIHLLHSHPEVDDNIASKRVLEKAGMTLEGHRRKILPIRGTWVDNFEFAILEDDSR